MNDRAKVLSHLHIMLERLRNGRIVDYLEIHRTMAESGIYPEEFGTTDGELRGLWRACVLAEARAAFKELKRGDRNQYAVTVKTLALIAETPDAIGTTAEELRGLWRKAAFAAARECHTRLMDGDAIAFDELIDHLAHLGADPEALGTTLRDLREARTKARAHLFGAA